MPLGSISILGECLDCLKNHCLHFFSVAIDPILLKLTDKEEMHTIFDVVQFWPDCTKENIIYALEHPKNTQIGL